MQLATSDGGGFVHDLLHDFRFDNRYSRLPRADPGRVRALVGMRTPAHSLACATVIAGTLTALAGCGLVWPTCKDEDSPLFHATGQVAANGLTSYRVGHSQRSIRTVARSPSCAVLRLSVASSVDHPWHHWPSQQLSLLSTAADRRGDRSRRRTAEYQRRARRGRERKHQHRVKAKTTRRQPATPRRRPASTLMRAPSREPRFAEWSSSHRP